MAEPCTKQLASLESRRLVGVLDGCVHKIDLLSLLPHDLVHPEGVSLTLGDDTTRSLDEHVRLCSTYGAVQELEAKRRATQEAGVVRDIQNSLLDFLRTVRARGAPVKGPGSVECALQGVGPVPEDDRRAVRELAERLRGLRGILVERLLTTATEQRESKRRAQDASVSHQRNLELIEQLEREVTAAERERDEEMGRKNEVIRRTKSSIQQMEKDTEEYVTKTQTDSWQENLSDQRNSDGKRSRLRQDVDRLRTELCNLTAEHREQQGALRKKNYKVETEIENWIQKYDTDMGEKQARLENVSRIYEREKAELRELQRRRAELELEYRRIAEERRRAQELREEEERELATKGRAAVLIQAVWRGWRVRKDMKKKTKTKNKKSKKGKAKKGK